MCVVSVYLFSCFVFRSVACDGRWISESVPWYMKFVERICMYRSAERFVL